MGYADRDYMDSRGGAGFFLRGGIVKVIMLATVVAYLVEGILLANGFNLVDLFGVVPGHLIGDVWLWQLFTHTLLHDPGSLLHILFNMLFLHWFGTDLAVIYGTRRFLVLYFGGAACCALLYSAVAYVYDMEFFPAIGASGAIMAIMLVAAHVFPRRTILIMFLIPCPLWLLVVLYVGLDLYYPLVKQSHWLDSAGHLGGALFGAGFYWLWIRTGLIDRLFVRAGGRRVEVTPVEPSHEDVDVDRILDKIKRTGMGSLTDEEKETLHRASRERRGER